MNDNEAYKKYTTISQGANIRNLSFNIDFDYFLTLSRQPCFYCGSEGNGLNRLDSSVGYEKNNVVSCCTACNAMKGTLSPSDFVFQCEKIAKHNPTVETDIIIIKPYAQNLRLHEVVLIKESLRKNQGNRTNTAKELGISTTTLWRKMKEYNLTPITTFQKVETAESRTLTHTQPILPVNTNIEEQRVVSPIDNTEIMKFIEDNNLPKTDERPGGFLLVYTERTGTIADQLRSMGFEHNGRCFYLP